MDKEELICGLCQNEFNDNINVALLLPTCGHSYCRVCLQKAIPLLPVGKPFICPEDQIQCFTRQVKYLPVNQMIMKIIRKRNESPEKMFQSRRMPEDESYFFPLYKSQETENLKGLYTSQKSNTKIQNQENVSNVIDHMHQCQSHGKRLDIVCLDDLQQLCVDCALFGQHKGHNFKSLEQVIDDIYCHVNQMLEIFGKLSDNLLKLNDSKIESKVEEQLNICVKNIEKKVDEQFNEIFELIKLKKQSILQEISDKCAKYQDSFMRKQRRLFKEINEQADLWKMSAQEKLQNFTAKTEANQLSFEILKYSADMPLLGKQLIEKVDKAILEFNAVVKEFSTLPIQININYKSLQKSFDSNITTNNNILIEQESKISQFIYYHEFQLNIQSLIQGQNEDQNILQKDASFFDLTEDLNQNQEVIQDIVLTERITDHFTEEQKSSQIKNNDSNIRIDSFNEILALSSSGLYISKEKKNNDKFINNLQFLIPIKFRSESPVSPKPLSTSTNTTLLGNRSIGPNKKKPTKQQEKNENLMAVIKSDSVELVDFQQSDLFDSNITNLCEALKNNKKIKVIKLMRNKITDEGAIKLFDTIIKETNINSVHLQSNMISDRAIDYLLNLVRGLLNKQQINLKHLYLNQNFITVPKNKKKVDEIKRFGVIVYI